MTCRLPAALQQLCLLPLQPLVLVPLLGVLLLLLHLQRQPDCSLLCRLQQCALLERQVQLLLFACCLPLQPQR